MKATANDASLKPFMALTLHGGAEPSQRSLREALKQLSRNDLRVSIKWGDIELLLFPASRPEQMFAKPSSILPVLQQADSTGGDVTPDFVHEMVVDHSLSRLYLLLSKGEVQVWNSSDLLGCTAPMFAEQLLTYELSPPDFGVDYHPVSECMKSSSKGGVALDVHCETNLGDHISRNREAARRLILTAPSMRIMRLCPQTGVVILNTFLGDNCFRVHEPQALRRVHRTRLDLPSMGSGIFDTLDGAYNSAAPSTKCVRDYAYLPDAEFLVCIVEGSCTIPVVCCTTGLVVACLVGHVAPPRCLLHEHGSGHLLTGGGQEDCSVRVWDMSAQIAPLSTAWSLAMRGFLAQGENPSEEISALEAAVAGESRPFSPFLSGPSQGAPLAGKLALLGPILLSQLSKRTGSWRTGRVTSIVDRRVLDSARGSTHHTRGKPVVEVLLDDGNVVLDPDLHLLRRPAEASRGKLGPRWHDRPASPVIGTPVALWVTAAGVGLGMGDKIYAASSAIFRGFGETCSEEEFVAVLGHALDGHWESISLADIRALARSLGDQSGNVMIRPFCSLLAASVAASTASSISDLRSIQQLASHLNRVVPSSRILLGHESAVTSICYMPVAMLIVSADLSGRMRFWDPCAQNHPLTATTLRAGYQDRVDATQSACPFQCVLEVAANLKADSGAVSGMTCVVMAGPPKSAQIICSSEALAACRDLDMRDAQLEGVRSARGFVYLLHYGDVVHVPTSSFDERMVRF